MSIEIIEEAESTEATQPANDFLPPVVSCVRNCGRSVLGFVISGLLVLSAIAVSLMSPEIGLPAFAVGCMMLFTDIIGFVRSKRLDGRFALNLRQKCYWFSGAVLLVLSVLGNFADMYGEYAKLFASTKVTLYDILPFTDLFVGSFNAHILFATIGLCTVLMGCVYWSLNHSKHRNYPYCAVAFVSFSVNVIAFAVLIFGGLSYLKITPETPLFKTTEVSFFSAGLYFAFGTVVLLWAIRSIIIFARMRKVKNAVFKA